MLVRIAVYAGWSWYEVGVRHPRVGGGWSDW